LFANPVGCRPSPCKMRGILRFQAEVFRKHQFPNNSIKYIPDSFKVYRGGGGMKYLKIKRRAAERCKAAG
jgi:hypothetical protein